MQSAHVSTGLRSNSSLAGLVLLMFATFLSPAPLAAQVSTEIRVSFSKVVSHEPLSGSIYLLVSRALAGEPRQALRDGPFDGIVLRQDVHDLIAGETVVFDVSTPGHPSGLSRLEPGRYAIQAIFDTNRTTPDFTVADGNGKSGSRRVDLGDGGFREIVIDDLLSRPRREDVGRLRYRYIESRIVGRQIGNRFFIPTAVMMPLNFNHEDSRRYPVQYWIPERGDDVRSALKYFQKRGIYFPAADGSSEHCREFILVLIDPNSRHGFHGFLDSAGHGAFREALFSEVIPAIEEEFPVLTDPAGRYLVGSGAGGLAALRLQVENPKAFAGVWALAPDPVSHRDFFGLDLTADPLANAFVDQRGRERTLVRREGKKLLGIREQLQFESVIGTDGLFQSYAAMYAPLDQDLEPRKLIDLATGTIDPEVARAFDRHDFLANLEAGWDELRDDLRGKLHVLVGDDDDFYLHRGVAILKSFLDGAGAEAEVEILPGLDHAAMESAEINLRVQREILADWQKKSAAR